MYVCRCICICIYIYIYIHIYIYILMKVHSSWPLFMALFQLHGYPLAPSPARSCLLRRGPKACTSVWELMDGSMIQPLGCCGNFCCIYYYYYSLSTMELLCFFLIYNFTRTEQQTVSPRDDRLVEWTTVKPMD